MFSSKIKYSKILQVTDQDIFCGRGRGLESFPGNKVFRQIIKEHAAMYIAQGTSRAERSRMVRLISVRLSSEGMRFVKRASKGWIPLEDYDAKLKIGHALRDAGSRLQSEASKKKATTKKRQKQHWKEMDFEKFVGVVSDDEGSVATAEDGSIVQQQVQQQQQEEQQISLLEEEDISIDLNIASLPDVDLELPTESGQKLQVTEEEDKWAPLPVDMEKPFHPRFSLKSITLAIPFEAFELTDDDADDCPPSPSNDFSKPFNDSVAAEEDKLEVVGAMQEEDMNFDVSLADVFLKFLEDEGETNIIAGQDINPDQWLSPSTRNQVAV